MKCINCIYYPCIRLECNPKSCCDYFKSIVEEELRSIDNRAYQLERGCIKWEKTN